MKVKGKEKWKLEIFYRPPVVKFEMDKNRESFQGVNVLFLHLSSNFHKIFQILET